MSHRRNAPNSGHWFSSYLKRNGFEAQSNMQDKLVQEVIEEDDEWFDVGGEEEENEKKRVEGEKKEGKKWDLGVWRCGLEGYEDTLPSDDKATETENSGDTGLPNSAGDDSGTLEGGGAKIVAEVKDENHKCEEGVMKMPSLFTLSLPPCGLGLQIAYENIVHRLRTLYLSSPRPSPSSHLTHVLSICTAIHTALATEVTQFPITPSRHRAHLRTPWRRESVVLFESHWVAYFVREAGMMAQWASMTEAQQEKQDFSNRLYPIPKELGIVVRNRRNRRGVVGLWEAWHKEKRADVFGDGDEDEDY